MSFFPVSNSTLSAEHLARFLQDRYSLSAQTTCRIIRAGINDTYIVNDGKDKFVFRVYKFGWRNETEITEEIRLLENLRKHHISVSSAIADREGNYQQTLNAPEGDRTGVLFTYAKGKKNIHYAPEVHFRIGEIMAQLHNVVLNRTIDRITYTPEVLLTDSLTHVAEFLPEDTDEMHFMRKAQKYLLAEFDRADISALRKGVVHIDIWFDNLNIADDGAITLFDFDFCGNGMLALDLGLYLMELHFIETVETELRIKSESFLAGYESVTKLSAEEKRLLPHLGASLYFYYLGVQCQRFDNYSNVFLSETYLKKYIIARVKKFFDFWGMGAELD